MTIAEMHVWFRQYAQQMGMQNVRAILPEQIDILINTSITDTVNQVIAKHIAVTGNRGIIDNAKLGQVNSLSYLYKVITVNAVPLQVAEPGQPFVADKNHSIYSQSAYIVYFTQALNGFSYLYLVDFAIEYFDSNDNLTNWFPVRIVEDEFLADALNDFILKPKVSSPIIVVHNDKVDLYIDKATYEDDIIHLPHNVKPSRLRVSYIDKPAVVEYNKTNPSASVDCDLPEYMHVDILKHAVDLYRIAVNNGTYGNQQQQVQNPSTGRIAGTGNEGYQS